MVVSSTIGVIQQKHIPICNLNNGYKLKFVIKIKILETKKEKKNTTLESLFEHLPNFPNLTLVLEHNLK